jgi:hypothetical protein
MKIFFTIMISVASVFCNNILALSPISITVTDRSGNNVSAQTLVNSDNIHIIASSSTEIVSYLYKYIAQAAEPTTGEWDATNSSEFYEDLYFYRKNENQWVQLKVTDDEDNSSEFIYGLQGGTLTAPPDDPITPVEYVAAMGPGLIVAAESDNDATPELDVVGIKKAGFYHVRMHIGRSSTINLDGVMPESEYFQVIDRWIEQITRHGMYCHIGNNTRSGRGLDETDDGSDAWNALYHAEILDWWTKVGHYYQNTSHRLAYHMFLETGKRTICKSSSKLNNLYTDVTEGVRKVDSARLLIYAPPSANGDQYLPEMTFPYPDLDPDDGIKTGSGNYFFSDFHQSFASGAHWQTDDDKKSANDRFDHVISWSDSTQIPLILSACRPTRSGSEQDEYLSNRIKYIEHQRKRLDEANYPIQITWLTHNGYNRTNGEGWIEEKLIILEAMNGEAIINENDPDGDLISTEDEINIYHTDPNSADSDSDNILDTYECNNAELNPNDSSDGDPYSDIGINADYDGDGMGMHLSFYILMIGEEKIKLHLTLIAQMPGMIMMATML